MIAGKKHAFSQLRMDLGTLTPTQLSLKWDCKYHQFLTDICSKNGTVALHHGMLLHAVSIVGLHDAEWLEGQQGLLLLLATTLATWMPLQTMLSFVLSCCTTMPKPALFTRVPHQYYFHTPGNVLHVTLPLIHSGKWTTELQLRHSGPVHLLTR